MRQFDGRTALVTGADGFIGSHLTEQLVVLGAHVRVLCWYDKDGSLGWLDDLEPEIRSAIDVRLGDVRDAEFVRSLCEDIHTVFHLAALISIPYSYEAPRSFVDTNVTGTLNVLEACRAAGVQRLVNTSTSEVYGTPDELPIRESHPLRGQSPYSASKIGADKLCEAYALSFDVPAVTLRPFNTYGPRQSLRAIIPTVLTQLMAGRQRIELGNLTPRRDFTFVSDTVEGFLRMASSDVQPGEVIQLGTGEATSIVDLVEQCIDVVGVDAEVVQDPQRVRPEGSEVEVLLSDPSLAGERLGWKPTVGLRDGLEQVVAWLEPRLDRFSATRYHR